MENISSEEFARCRPYPGEPPDHILYSADPDLYQQWANAFVFNLAYEMVEEAKRKSLHKLVYIMVQLDARFHTLADL